MNYLLMPIFVFIISNPEKIVSEESAYLQEKAKATATYCTEDNTLDCYNNSNRRISEINETDYLQSIGGYAIFNYSEENTTASEPLSEQIVPPTPSEMYFTNESDANLLKSATQTRVFQEYPWPVKREALVEGDIVIGGLMMVHEREDSITCGPVMPQGGIQALEAMMFTIDQINSGSVFALPNITIGAHVLDDCDKDTYGLEMAVDFIKGAQVLDACDKDTHGQEMVVDIIRGEFDLDDVFCILLKSASCLKTSSASDLLA
ncbi:unnamed protein product [Phaedon cochleariae]|uniref:Uncharacterized protein n=1 Tax=Phaedon cochleariae TaxID=80249 RepID=A0A9P0DIT2_PHACE|nr:unnamed protein product [Phaedon cochleariae]